MATSKITYHRERTLAMVMPLEGTVENGQIHLRDHITLPENTKVYVIVPGEAAPAALVGSPQLVHPEQIADFKKTLKPKAANDGI